MARERKDGATQTSITTVLYNGQGSNPFNTEVSQAASIVGSGGAV